MAKMQSDGTDVASSFRSTLGFSSRADQIFGALGSPSFEGPSESTIAPWTVSQDRVFRSGKEAYSSDEDEEAKEMDRRQKDILPESMQELEDDELGGEAFRPSAAFCRALDNEQEYDSIDDIAMAGDLGEALPGLASTTEVLEDNIYEQRARQRLEADAGKEKTASHTADVHHPSASVPFVVEEGHVEKELEKEGSVDSMETGEDPASESRVPSSTADRASSAKLPPALKSSKAEESSAEAQPAPALAPDEDEQRRSKKKVRFQMDQPWVPPHRRSSDWGDRPRSATPSGQAAAGPSTFGSGPREQRRRSFVPDHVKNPQRYTCYDLGESITVGGGDQGITAAADGGQADMQRAAGAALSAAASMPAAEHTGTEQAAQEEERELPAFGSGLEFRSQGKLAASKSPAAAADAAIRANDGSLAISLAEEYEVADKDDSMDHDDEQVDAQNSLTQTAEADDRQSKPGGGRPRAQRNFRSKA